MKVREEKEKALERSSAKERLLWVYSHCRYFLCEEGGKKKDGFIKNK